MVHSKSISQIRFGSKALRTRCAPACLMLLGLYALLQVRGLVASGERVLAIIDTLGGMLLLGLGVFGVYVGLFKVFRFYVGRGQPADLATSVSSQGSVMPGAATGGATGFRSIYQPITLAEMLLGRKNPTFREPEGWLPRLLHTFARNLIFLPYALRNDAAARFVAAAHSVVILALLGLAWFAGATGLVPMAGTPVMQWLVARGHRGAASSVAPGGGAPRSRAARSGARVQLAPPLALGRCRRARSVRARVASRSATAAAIAVLAVSVVRARALEWCRGVRLQPRARVAPLARVAAADARHRVSPALAGIRASDGHLPCGRDHARQASFRGDTEPDLRKRRARAHGAGLAGQRGVQRPNRSGDSAAADCGPARGQADRGRHRRGSSAVGRVRDHAVRAVARHSRPHRRGARTDSSSRIDSLDCWTAPCPYREPVRLRDRVRVRSNCVRRYRDVLGVQDRNRHEHQRFHALGESNRSLESHALAAREPHSQQHAHRERFTRISSSRVWCSEWKRTTR